MPKRLEINVIGKVIGQQFDDETEHQAKARIVFEAEQHGNHGTSRLHLSLAEETENKAT